ncbi:hypothetical protein [Streptomyces sp. WAC06614]|uniref:hypothetical protein n=1 Tax=Streptomyces sp. WAC06614 TaxID=2487416 RepID=UPI001C8D662E|nr:hypothetical protein [Streptomyces sp. WAC06614]
MRWNTWGSWAGGAVDEVVEPAHQPLAQLDQFVAVEAADPGDAFVGGHAGGELAVELVPVHPATRDRLEDRPDLGVRHARGVVLGLRVGQRDGIAFHVLAAYVQVDGVDQAVAGHELEPAPADGQAQVEADPFGAEGQGQRAAFGHRLQGPVGAEPLGGAVLTGADEGGGCGHDRVGGGHGRAGVGGPELAELPLPGEHPERVADLHPQGAAEVGGPGPAFEPVPQADGGGEPVVERLAQPLDAEVGRVGAGRFRHGSSLAGCRVPDRC